MRLEGKTALVTGGGTGIGAAITRRFVAEGANVVITGRRLEPLATVADETGAVICQGDAGNTEDVRRAVETAVERFGGLDIAIPNAAAAQRGGAGDLDDEGWQNTISNTLTSAFLVCRESLPHLLERQGHIVVISSLAGHFAGPRSVAYTACKHALTGLVKSVARDYGPDGVHVTGICPAWTRTPMADRAMGMISDARDISHEEAYDWMMRNTPLNRAAEPEEIASIALFLATDESRAIQGAMIMADGGAHIVDVPTIDLAELRAANPTVN